MVDKAHHAAWTRNSGRFLAIYPTRILAANWSLSASHASNRSNWLANTHLLVDDKGARACYDVVKEQAGGCDEETCAGVDDCGTAARRLRHWRAELGSSRHICVHTCRQPGRRFRPASSWHGHGPCTRRGSYQRCPQLLSGPPFLPLCAQEIERCLDCLHRESNVSGQSGERFFPVSRRLRQSRRQRMGTPGLECGSERAPDALRVKQPRVH
jgi:hypothetical protein